jgi:hypothetical protein
VSIALKFGSKAVSGCSPEQSGENGSRVPQPHLVGNPGPWSHSNPSLPSAEAAQEIRSETDEPALFCAEVRNLAGASQKALAGAARNTGEALSSEIEILVSRSACLKRRIGRLRRLHGLPLVELDRWAGKLQEQLELTLARIERSSE